MPFKLSAPYGWQTLTTQIFSKAVGDDANVYLGSAMSMALGIITVILIWIQQRYIAPRSFITVTGKGFRPNVIDLGRWRWAAFAFNLAYILVAVVLPILCLFVVSLHPVWQAEIIPSDLTLHNYVRTLFFWAPDHIAAATNGIVNSFILAFAGATIAMVLSLVVSNMIHRTKGFGARLLDFLCVVPIGFPGIVHRDGRAGDLHQDADLRDAVDPAARLHHALLSLRPAQRLLGDAGDLGGTRPEFAHGRRVLVHHLAADHHPAAQARHLRRLGAAVHHLPARAVDLDHPLHVAAPRRCRSASTISPTTRTRRSPRRCRWRRPWCCSPASSSSGASPAARR